MHRRNVIPLMLGLVLAAALPAAAAPPEPPTTLPSFDLEALDGGRVTSGDLAGKVALVDLWATWCAPCVQEIPHWNALLERYGAQGFTVLGITLRSGWAEDIRKDLAGFDVRVDYPLVVGDDDLEFELAVTGYPTTLLVDRDGTIRKTYTGNTEGKLAEVEADVAKLLSV